MKTRRSHAAAASSECVDVTAASSECIDATAASTRVESAASMSPVAPDSPAPAAATPTQPLRRSTRLASPADVGASTSVSSINSAGTGGGRGKRKAAGGVAVGSSSGVGSSGAREEVRVLAFPGGEGELEGSRFGARSVSGGDFVPASGVSVLPVAPDPPATVSATPLQPLRRSSRLAMVSGDFTASAFVSSFDSLEISSGRRKRKAARRDTVGSSAGDVSSGAGEEAGILAVPRGNGKVAGSPLGSQSLADGDFLCASTASISMAALDPPMIASASPPQIPLLPSTAVLSASAVASSFASVGTSGGRGKRKATQKDTVRSSLELGSSSAQEEAWVLDMRAGEVQNAGSRSVVRTAADGKFSENGEVALDIAGESILNARVEDVGPSSSKGVDLRVAQMSKDNNMRAEKHLYAGVMKLDSGRFMNQKEERSVHNSFSEETSNKDVVTLLEVAGETSHQAMDDASGSRDQNVLTHQRRREEAKKSAIQLAPKFAFFKAEEDSSGAESELEITLSDAGQEDWPGPFSTAKKIREQRADKLRERELNASKLGMPTDVGISWKAVKAGNFQNIVRPAPSIIDLSLKLLVDYADEISSFEGISDDLKHKIGWMLCHSRKMDDRLLNELLGGSPSQIHVYDCSWITENEFEKAFGNFDTTRLKVLQLDLCGRCMPDYILRATLAKAPNSLPSLLSVSLKGAYRLSDDGLSAFISSAPLLCSLNLSQCSLLTSKGIAHLAENLSSILKILRIDGCQNIDALFILPALKKVKHLEVLSMADVPSVSHKFVRQLVQACGSTLKELSFANCSKLTTSSIEAIAKGCPQLYALDIQNLNRLNDAVFVHLASCNMIRKLKLRQNVFSDEAVAAFLDSNGSSLVELSLNNAGKVGNCTAISIASKCHVSLKSLDLSFCREMSNEALGLIVDSCPSLRTLKLFGCSQITDVFLEGHSNPMVAIIGLRGDIMDHMEIPSYAFYA